MENKKPQKIDTKKNIWLGAQHLMKKPQNGQEEKERRLLLLTSRVLGVSPFGVNILGGLPYINKIGLSQKLKQYAPDAKVVYRWVRVAEDDTQKAVCEAKVVDGDVELTDWVVGECSPSTQRMGTLKGYQNHMAQTRAKNRAILEAFGIRIHEEMLERIELLHREREIEDKDVEVVGSSVNSSAEELVVGDKKNVKNESGGEGAAEKLKKLARELGAKEGEEKKFIEEKVGHSINFENASERHFTLIKSRLLAAVIKNQ